MPFVGCKSDGQTGPIEAPSKRDGKSVAITREAAEQLAYYEAAQGPGVLAPRGWYCFGTYGSAGTRLFISPQRIETAKVFSSKWEGLGGPAIEIDEMNGGTSGRFRVAEVIARVFPAYLAFANRVAKEREDTGEPPFPFGPYPTDSLVYRSNSVVEYQTPAGADGLATAFSGLKKSGDPVTGVAILVGQYPDLLLVAVRLPPALGGLAPAIVGEFERETAHRPQGQN